MPSETDVKEVRSTCQYCGVSCGLSNYVESQRRYQGREGSWYYLRASHVPKPTPAMPRRRMIVG